jgi:hypothetical protein
MAVEKRIYELVPGQQAPKGSLRRTHPNGGVVWEGEEGTFPKDIISHVMTTEEENIWNDFLAYEAKIRTLGIDQLEGLMPYDKWTDTTKLSSVKTKLQSIIDEIDTQITSIIK